MVEARTLHPETGYVNPKTPKPQRRSRGEAGTEPLSTRRRIHTPGAATIGHLQRRISCGHIQDRVCAHLQRRILVAIFRRGIWTSGSGVIGLWILSFGGCDVKLWAQSLALPSRGSSDGGFRWHGRSSTFSASSDHLRVQSTIWGLEAGALGCWTTGSAKGCHDESLQHPKPARIPGLTPTMTCGYS